VLEELPTTSLSDTGTTKKAGAVLEARQTRTGCTEKLFRRPRTGASARHRARPSLPERASASSRRGPRGGPKPAPSTTLAGETARQPSPSMAGPGTHETGP